jgi:hypothetical protein
MFDKCATTLRRERHKQQQDYGTGSIPPQLAGFVGYIGLDYTALTFVGYITQAVRYLAKALQPEFA